MKIVIDAGHGLHTAGKRAPDDSMREYHFNRATAFYVREMLEKRGHQILTTHSDVLDVPLKERTNRANACGADLFVSIHANACKGDKWSDACGIETFIHPTATKLSEKLAHAVQKKLISATGLRDRGVKRKDLHVLRETKMPAILVECGFMDNKDELKLLKSDTYRQKCAKAIVEGIMEVFKLKKKPKTEKKKLDYPVVKVEVNGKPITNGIVIDGVSYFPGRALAEALNVDVKWDKPTETVKMTTK